MTGNRQEKPGSDYCSDINNLVYVCYWCNNAKTNYFTYEKFKKIGEKKEIQQLR